MRDQELTKLLNMGVIDPSLSFAASHILLRRPTLK